MSWKGTPVPNSGTINKIYFNTNLSNDEVLNTINSLEFKEVIEGSGLYAYNVVWGYYGTDEATFFQILIQKYDNAIIIEYKNSIGGAIQNLFTYNVEGSENGWTSNAISPIVPSETPCNLREIKDGFYIGTQNDKLSSLFSITPFEEVQEVTLDSWAEDIADAIREKKEITTGNWGGKTVPNSGTVDKLYFNDKVSFQEIYNLLSSIEYAPYDDNGFFEVYIALNCDGGSSFGVIKKNNTDTPRGIEYDINVDDELFWTSVNDEGFTSYGLNVLATQQNYGYIPNTGEALDKDSIGNKEYEVGLQNDKLSSLISTSPFFRKIPRLNFAQEIRNIETGGEGIEGIIEVEELPEIAQQSIPNSGFVEKISINTALSYDEVQDILSNSFDNVLSDIVNVNGKDYTPLGIIAIDENNYIIISGTFSSTEGNKFGIERILNGTEVTLFDQNNGWTTEGLNTKSIELNSEVVSYIDSISIYFGKYNEQLTRLFSINSKEQEFDVSKIYYLNQKMGDICAYTGSFWTSMKDLVENNGGKVYAIVVKDKPTENIKVTDLNSMIMYAYFVENENDIFLYADWTGEGNPSWLSFSVAMFSGEVTYGGQITDVSEATDPTKYYTMAVQKFYKYSNGWVEYKYGGIIPDGSLTVTQNGEYDITSYKTVDVNIEDKSLEVHKTYLFSKSINWQSISWDKFNFTLSLNGHIFREKTITGLDSGKLIIPKCVSSIGEYCFYHCRSIAEVSFDGNSCVSIGKWCFSGCDKLTSIIFPDDIKTIPISVASGCDLLTNVVLPKNCTRIERNAFEICNNLTYVEIPATVVSIGRQAFNAVSDNDKLLTVKMLGSTPPTLEDTNMGFSLVFLVDKILIPSGSLTAFEQSWSLYAGKFEEY